MLKHFILYGILAIFALNINAGPSNKEETGSSGSGHEFSLRKCAFRCRYRSCSKHGLLDITKNCKGKKKKRCIRKCKMSYIKAAKKVFYKPTKKIIRHNSKTTETSSGFTPRYNLEGAKNKKSS